LAQAGFLGWTDRVGALITMATSLGALAFAAGQLSHLNVMWLSIIGGALAGTSALMPIYAWGQRGVKVPAMLFALAVTGGLITWPFAWQGGPATEAPWFWPCIGAAAVVLCIGWNTVVAIVASTLMSVAFIVVRISPSGGAVAAFVAVQDALLVGVQPLLIVLLFAHMRRQAALVDARVNEARRLESEAAIQTTLEAQRSQLDAVIHDHVMTTLVGAARSAGSHDPHVTELANHAIARLQAHVVGDDGAVSFAPIHVEQLIGEAALATSPLVRVSGTVEQGAGPIPAEAVRALAQATREAVLNGDKHARANVIGVTTSIAAVDGRVSARVEIADDGVGFDTAMVPERRLGIRLSLRERMRTSGGDATISSEPGAGTTVVLTWASDEVDEGDASGNALPPIFAAITFGPMGWVLGISVLVSAIGGMLASFPAAPAATSAAVGCLLASAWVALVRFGHPFTRVRTVAVVGLGLGATAFGLLASSAPWSIHQAWLAGGVSVVAVLLLVGVQRFAAWLLAVTGALLLVVSAVVAEVTIWPELVIAAEPIAWLIVAEMLLAWMTHVQGDLDAARRQSESAAAATAEAFAALVLREVWLADMREEFGGMLEKLRDPSYPITQVDREECLALEGRLRDGIKSSNLSAPALSAAVMAARMRGIDVTLIDNRGSSLGEEVRRSAVRHLVDLVTNATSGRIVARTAPEGYDEAVTIVQADANGSTLTKVLNDGTIVVSQT
jgi:signal transduction histidine kinase